MAAPPPNTACVVCHSLGHFCQAKDTDGDGSPLCFDCADGEDCFYVRKNRGSVPLARSAEPQQEPTQENVSDEAEGFPTTVSTRDVSRKCQTCDYMMAPGSKAKRCHRCYAKNKKQQVSASSQVRPPAMVAPIEQPKALVAAQKMVDEEVCLLQVPVSFVDRYLANLSPSQKAAIVGQLIFGVQS